EGVPEGGGSFVCGKLVILSTAKDLKKRKKRYLTFVRYDTVREPVILSEAKNLNATLLERDVSLRST
ncbi:MAG: hypothetical protein IJ513_05110, partial [Bacteroidaceae bacterium]|nr:hypothetical protein [Bacteroidaceae bacterium]